MAGEPVVICAGCRARDQTIAQLRARVEELADALARVQAQARGGRRLPLGEEDRAVLERLMRQRPQ